MGKEIKITFLGTADSVPSSTRNHTGILISYKGENILVDCGEGIQRQFKIAKLNPCKLTKILITHEHADHTLGLPGLLKTLQMSGYQKDLVIYGPKGFKKFMENIFNAFGYVNGFNLKIEELSPKGQEVFFDDGDFCLVASSMKHGVPCNGYSFVRKGSRRIDKKKLRKFKIGEGKHLQELKDGKDVLLDGRKLKFRDLTYLEDQKKISVVLDTVDNPNIIPLVRDSDIFVSEASFGSELEEKAGEHNHMTAKQVGKIAKKAKVKKLVLTHVGQRYDKNKSQILNEAKKEFSNVVLVKDFDAMEIE